MGLRGKPSLMVLAACSGEADGDTLSLRGEACTLSSDGEHALDCALVAGCFCAGTGNPVAGIPKAIPIAFWWWWCWWCCCCWWVARTYSQACFWHAALVGLAADLLRGGSAEARSMPGKLFCDKTNNASMHRRVCCASRAICRFTSGVTPVPVR
jgi:hypothetical protein